MVNTVSSLLTFVSLLPLCTDSFSPSPSLCTGRLGEHAPPPGAVHGRTPPAWSGAGQEPEPEPVPGHPDTCQGPAAAPPSTALPGWSSPRPGRRATGQAALWEQHQQGSQSGGVIRTGGPRGVPLDRRVAPTLALGQSQELPSHGPRSPWDQLTPWPSPCFLLS